MLFYTVLCFFLLLPFFLGFSKAKVGFELLAFGVSFIFPALLFKGVVGTDTFAYLEIIQRIREAETVASSLGVSPVEPGFTLLVKVMTIVVEDNLLILNALASIVVLIFFIGVMRFHGRARYLLAAVLFSHYFVPYSFNVVRVGLALGVAFLGVTYYLQSKRIAAVLLFVLAVSMHVSVALFPVILYLFMNRLSFKKFAFALLVFIPIIFIFYGHISEKVYLYLNSGDFADASGASLIILHFCILAYCIFLRQDIWKNGQAFLFVTSIFLFFGVQYFYALIRVTDIILLSSTLIAAIDVKTKRDGQLLVADLMILIFVVVSTFFVLRSIYYEAGLSGSSYIPYTSFWMAR